MNPNRNNSSNQPPRRYNNRPERDIQNDQPSTPSGPRLSTSRGQAVRAQKRSQMDAQRIADQYTAAVAPQSDGQTKSQRHRRQPQTSRYWSRRYGRRRFQEYDISRV